MLELSLSRSSPTNTILTDGRNRPMYSVRTPYRWVGGTTRISRFTNRRGDQPHCEDDACRVDEIAKIHWRCRGTPKLMYNGPLEDVDAHVSSNNDGLFGVYYGTRAFTERDGKTFHWKRAAMGTWQLELDDPARGTVVIAYERLKNPSHCPEAIIVEDVGLLMLDRVVSTWVLFESEKHRYNDDHSAGSPSSSLVKSS